MNVLFDTNVILDVMFDRPLFSEPASQLLAMVEKGDLAGIICATTVTTIHYLATKILGKSRSENHIRHLLTLFEIATVNRTVIEDALKAGFNDFEDAVISLAAFHAGAEAIVTRDAKGFQHSAIPFYSPPEMLAILQTTD